MIQLTNVERTYKTPAGVTWVLRRINLNIQEGEFVTIMGASGAGKSTLLNVIGMLDDGWSGEYRLLDHDVHKLDRKKRGDLSRQYMGFVFQSYHLLDNLTVYENLDVPLSYRNVGRSQRASMSAMCWTDFRSLVRRTFIRINSRADNSSWWESHALWLEIPSSSLPTNPRAICIHRKRKKSWSCSESSTSKGQRSSR